MTEATRTVPKQAADTLRRVDSSENVLAVVAGALAVFATDIVNGEPEGPRRHLLNVQAGELLFGMGAQAGSRHQAIIAVELAESRVSTFPASRLADLFDSDRRDLLDRVEKWVRYLTGIFDGLPRQVSPHQAEPGTVMTLEPGQAIAVSEWQLAWIHVASGKLRWMSQPELAFGAETGPFPLAGKMWLEAVEHTRVSVVSSDGIAEFGDLMAGLDALHALYHRWLQLLRDRDTNEGFQRFVDRQKADATLTHKALEELTTLLEPPPQVPIVDKTPLLAACRTVGKRLGIEIMPPSVSDNPDRPGDVVVSVARASRCRARQTELNGAWWRKDCGPLVAFSTETRRPVALLPRRGGGYEIIDSVAGTSTKLTPDLATTLDRTAYMFYRPLPHKPLKALDLVKFASKGRLADFITFLLLSQAATLLAIIGPMLMGVLVDQAIPESNHSLLLDMGMAMGAAAIGMSVFRLCEGLVQLRIETQADGATQAAVWDRVLGLGAPFFRKYSVGDLSMRVNVITMIRQKLSGATTSTIFSGIFSVQYVVLMFVISPQLAVLAVLLAFVCFVVTLLCSLMKYRVPRGADINEILIKLITGVAKIRVAGAENRAFAHWSKEFAQRQRAGLLMARVEDLLRIINEVFLPLTSLILFWYAFASGAVVGNRAGVMTTGAFLAFNAAYGAFMRAATRMSDIVIQLIDVNRLWKVCKPILESVPESRAGSEDPGRLSGRISLNRVSFRYRPDAPYVLRDVSMEIEPGEEIAIVGPSGCGKSTLIRLLLGFESPTAGKLYYDGLDLAKLDLPAVRRQLGVVLQDSKLMAGSIFDNVAAGAVITREEAWNGLDLAGIRDEIEAMPMGLETIVSEGGANLSGGQRQRILLARAFALEPKIMIFDEATSHLDAETQEIVTESMHKLCVSRIVIAHRLSTIRKADRIYVMDDGRLVQKGTFDELVAEEGLFANLIARQMA
jgi:ATP-binding cassette subfamily C protein